MKVSVKKRINKVIRKDVDINFPIYIETFNNDKYKTYYKIINERVVIKLKTYDDSGEIKYFLKFEDKSTSITNEIDNILSDVFLFKKYYIISTEKKFDYILKNYIKFIKKWR